MKPVHRSFLFWLGILPGVFLLSAWIDSSSHTTMVQIPVAGTNLSARQQQGEFHASYTTGSAVAYDPEISRWEDGRAYYLGKAFFPRPRLEAEEPYVIGQGKLHYLVLPHWLLLCLWFGFFLVGLDMRNKRRQLIEELPPEDSDPPAPHAD